jgi:hypothetical protein
MQLMQSILALCIRVADAHAADMSCLHQNDCDGAVSPSRVQCAPDGLLQQTSTVHVFAALVCYHRALFGATKLGLLLVCSCSARQLLQHGLILQLLLSDYQCA